MKKLTMLVLSLVVVLAVVVAYWASVGFSSAIHDFSGGPDPDDSSSDDPVEAYAVFSIEGYYWWSDGPVMHVTISDIGTAVSEYVTFSEGRVYEVDKLDVLSPVPPPPDSVIGVYWVEVVVTGPAGYDATWSSSKMPLLDRYTASNMATYEFGTGRAFFDTEGTYTVQVTTKGTLTGTTSVLTLNSESRMFQVEW